MIDFANAKSIVIPEGEAAVIARGDEILWQKVKYKRELLYIESTDTQYIDTGYIPNTNTKVELSAGGINANTFPVTSGGWFVGSRTNYQVEAFGTYYNPGQQALYGAFGNHQSSVAVSTSDFYGKDHLFVIDKSGLYLDGNKKISFNNSFNGKHHLYLFTINLAGSTANVMRFKLYYFKVWESNNLVHDFIPVIGMDDVPCMYDKVTDELFYNQGTGKFAYGELPSDDARLPAEYQEVEYIEGTGTQWIDTGVTINTATDDVELIFQNTESAVYKWFFGGHDNNARFGLGSGDGVNKRNVAYGSNTYKVADTQQYNSQHTFVADENGAFIDGTKIANFASFASTSTLYLFNLNLNNGNYTASAKIWRYKQTRNGELIRDLIPCYRKSDNKPGMYDLVTETFFTNAGTGEFLYG